jgi:hypothetical protein
MKRVSAILLVAAALGLGSVLPARAQSQDRGPSLGDIARALRAEKKAELPVITNENFSHLPQLIRQTEQQALAAGLVPPVARRAEPEITCSLAFSAQSPSAPAAHASIPQDLPSSLLAKLDGPAVISGDTLQVSIYNGSSWDVQEITVGITVVKRENQVALLAAPAQLLPASDAGPAPMLKKPDETFLYHLKGSAPPSSTTAFKQALGLNLGPNDEWHWAILQARGLPPASPAPPQ